jgi:hypothetical protein
MWKAWILTALIPLSGSCLANPPTPAVSIHSDQTEIRTVRATYNKALASRDAEAISRYWLLDSQSVWANGRLTVGHDNIVARYRKTFKDGDFLFGLRTPQRIDVDPAGGTDAAEVGVWKWKMRSSGQEITWSGPLPCHVAEGGRQLGPTVGSLRHDRMYRR